MFIAGKIILKSALLAVGAATPFIAASPTGNGSTQPPVPAIVGTAQAVSSANAANHAAAPDAGSITIIRPGHPDEKIPISPGMNTPDMTKELKSLKDYLRNHSDTPNMTTMPQSYEIYLLQRSDGMLIGPNGVVPLSPVKPKVVHVAPAPAR